MPAPSVSWTVIPDGDIDPESPITTGLHDRDPRQRAVPVRMARRRLHAGR